MKIKLILILSIILVMAMLMGGCTVESGIFMGMSHNSSDTSLSASYMSFDGSIARRVKLKAEDEVQFAYQGDDGLTAAVIQSGTALCDITDGTVFTVPADGTYDFTVEGDAKEGAFTLTWSVE